MGLELGEWGHEYLLGKCWLGGRLQQWGRWGWEDCPVGKRMNAKFLQCL